ncbi:hypothetical protein MK292_04825 [Myxococcota bacterium]|nr:hypothetical protein [Myxococcota bacterium]
MPRILTVLVFSFFLFSCGSDPELEIIEGFYHPEDLEVLPDESLLLVSEYGGLNGEHATVISLINIDTQERSILFPNESTKAVVEDAAIWGNSDCPGAPEEISPHGIHMGQRSDGTDQLLVVNHRGRESVEFFELTGKDTQDPGLIWRGCVVAPDKEVWFNDVATLPGNGFVVTHMMPHGDISELLQRAETDQEPTGYVLEWLPETQWKKIPKSEGAINNGILASADGLTLYVAHYLGNQVVAIDRISGENLWTAQMPSPDNLSFNKSGDLLIASHDATLAEVRACSHSESDYCGINFSIVLVDPEDGSSQTIIEGSGAPFGGATVAVEAGDRIVMGSFTGNRIAITKNVIN